MWPRGDYVSYRKKSGRWRELGFSCKILLLVIALKIFLHQQASYTRGRAISELTVKLQFCSQFNVPFECSNSLASHPKIRQLLHRWANLISNSPPSNRRLRRRSRCAKFCFWVGKGWKKVAGILETFVLLANIYCLQFPGSLRGHKHG